VRSLAHAFYRHPAFIPHRLIRAAGVRRLWIRNAILTVSAATALTLCAWLDNALTIADGYGYLEHPGIFGWYLIQMIVPVAIYSTLKSATRSGKHYREIVPKTELIKFRQRVFEPMVDFVGFREPTSRALFALLFTFGFAAFAWNTFQNLFPGKLAPPDFWDSKHYIFGYVGTRFYKFYIDALLLPSVIHIFFGVVWVHLRAVRHLCKHRAVRLALFNPDKCGGFRFLADLILSPTTSGLLVSGLAFFGVVYTHRALDIETTTGILVQATVLSVFYIAPTFVLRSVLIQVKKRATREVHLLQEAHYEAVVSGELHGILLREAHEYLRYYNDISAQIDRIPNWPHLKKVSGIFGISISPALVVSLLNFATGIWRYYAGRR